MNKDLPQEITKKIKTKLYFKFFSLFILNNIFWIVLIFFNNVPKDKNEQKFQLSSDQTTMVIHSSHQITEDGKLKPYGLLNKKNELILNKVILIDQIKSDNNWESGHKNTFIISVNYSQIHKLLPYLDQNLKLIPARAIKNIKVKNKRKNYEISL